MWVKLWRYKHNEDNEGMFTIKRMHKSDGKRQGSIENIKMRRT
jgi:hypothetical protein